MLALAMLATSSSQAQEAQMVGPQDVPATSTLYVNNRAPLRPNVFIKLPLGSVKARGWVGEMLRRESEGLAGRLGEISDWLDKKGNAWLEEGGSHGWEEVPYWLRGYHALACQLADEAKLRESHFWIDAILRSAQPDGYFGPVNAGKDGRRELWANMLALQILQDYYEHTADERVLPVMTAYCRWELAYPDEKFLRDYWENSRGGDNLLSVIWLYNRTGEEFLLQLMRKIHRCTANWMQDTSLPNWHNVNVAECFREPATFSLLPGEERALGYTYNNFHLIRRIYGQVPGGMFGSDENCRHGYIDPRQGTETCGFAEQMLSDGVMIGITADPLWAENMEDVAFNSFPAAMMPDLRSLRYITSPNHTVSDSKNHHPGIDNRGPFLNMNPFSSRCCQHNHGLGWPSFIQSLAYSTPDGGVAYAVYGPNKATLDVAGGKRVTITEDTRYPFSDTLRFTIAAKEKAKYPIYFRIPSWTTGATAMVNGKLTGSPVAGEYLRIERTWKDGDRVELVFPMRLTVRRWPTNQNSASVNYGPLTLSLRIAEQYRKVNSAEAAIGDSRWQEGADPEKWPTWEIYAGSPWNYALILPDDNDVSRLTVRHKPWPADNQPFTREGAPIEVTALGRLIPSWGIDGTGLTGVLPPASAPRSDYVSPITLIPMGAARLRISSFPTSNK